MLIHWPMLSTIYLIKYVFYKFILGLTGVFTLKTTM